MSQVKVFDTLSDDRSLCHHFTQYVWPDHRGWILSLPCYYELLVLWLLSQVVLAALKVLWLLSWVALPKIAILKLLRMKREPAR